MTSTSDDFPRTQPFGVWLATAALKLVAMVAILGALLLLLGVGYLISREATWLPPAPAFARMPPEQRNQQAFFHGTIGTEVVPLPVLKVLPQICGEPHHRDHFNPLGRSTVNWIEEFGFLPASLAPESAPVNPLAQDLPLGFTVSHYRPKSGAPSPVVFVGLACATCHTTQINGKLVIGTGNSGLNLFAWIDAFQASLLDERVTYDFIMRKYEEDSANPPLTFEEKAMVRVWLIGIQRKLNEDVTKYDEPFGKGLSLLPENVPTGPGRTQPFRTLVRTLLHRPGADMKVYTKIAALYLEGKEEWGQFDGSVRGLYPRSAAAALAAGATPQNMSLDEIAHNIKRASDYENTLKPPKWSDVFPDKPINENLKKEGKAVYMDHCDRCHGNPECQKEPYKEVGQMVPVADINTDTERVSFRGFEEIPDRLTEDFPKSEGYPFKFPREDLRPKHRESPNEPVLRAYINKRMHGMFSRAPFLHNASVLTLAELINLEPRRAQFYRGCNSYDTTRVGLATPDKKDAKHYFLFDTLVPGNSNKGHDYPWPRSDVENDTKKKEALRALLEYLKTL